jgi:hypothetical protein
MPRINQFVCYIVLIVVPFSSAISDFSAQVNRIKIHGDDEPLYEVDFDSSNSKGTKVDCSGKRLMVCWKI